MSTHTAFDGNELSPVCAHPVSLFVFFYYPYKSCVFKTLEENPGQLSTVVKKNIHYLYIDLRKSIIFQRLMAQHDEF